MLESIITLATAPSLTSPICITEVSICQMLTGGQSIMQITPIVNGLSGLGRFGPATICHMDRLQLPTSSSIVFQKALISVKHF